MRPPDLVTRALPWILGAVLLVLFLRPAGSSDLGFHLRLGEEILRDRRVPTADRHSTTADGAPFIAQEWLTDVLFRSLESAAGSDAIALLCTLSAVAALLLTWAACEGPGGLRLLMVALLIPLADSHYHVRPHVLAWALVPALHLLLRRGAFAAVLALLVLWTNLHASFPLGVFLASLHFAERKAWPRAAACLAAPLLNPYGIRLFGFLWDLRGLPLEELGEFQAFPPSSPYFWALAAVLALAAVSLALLQEPQGRFPYGDLVRTVLVAALAFRGARFGILVGLALAPGIVARLAPLWRRIPREASRWTCATALAAGLAVPALGERPYGRLGVDEFDLPVRATSFLLSTPAEGPLLNDYNFGGYLLWKAWPRFPVFVDGRIDVYRGLPYEDYNHLADAAPDWKVVAARRGIRCILLRPDRRLVRVLLDDPDWELVYWDYNAVVFLPAAAWPEVRRLRNCTPFGHRDRNRIPELIDEVEYLLTLNERNFGAHKVLAHLYHRAGRREDARRAIARCVEIRPGQRASEDTQRILLDLGMR